MLKIAHEPAPLAADRDGIVRVGGTRVSLDSVVSAYLAGLSAEQIIESFPALSLADVYATIGYYLHHRAEVDEYLQASHAADLAARQHYAARHGQQPSRRELQRRQNK